MDAVIRLSRPVRARVRAGPSKAVMDGASNRLCGALEAPLSRQKDTYR